MKGSLEESVPVDPLIYRFHEITQVYGTTMKALIHEMFGDGIMSATDFEIDIQKTPILKATGWWSLTTASFCPTGNGR